MTTFEVHDSISVDDVFATCLFEFVLDGVCDDFVLEVVCFATGRVFVIVPSSPSSSFGSMVPVGQEAPVVVVVVAETSHPVILRELVVVQACVLAPWVEWQETQKSVTVSVRQSVFDFDDDEVAVLDFLDSDDGVGLPFRVLDVDDAWDFVGLAGGSNGDLVGRGLKDVDERSGRGGRSFGLKCIIRMYSATGAIPTKAVPSRVSPFCDFGFCFQNCLIVSATRLKIELEESFIPRTTG